jgi:hypothetical protein
VGRAKFMVAKVIYKHQDMRYRRNIYAGGGGERERGGVEMKKLRESRSCGHRRKISIAQRRQSRGFSR